ncbi:MAG: hypothetical protein HPY82_16190 [Gammaproteobacteria bacterium]|nr:hypothetical protein [Gammaproteobacteria bacterium]
MKQHKSKGQSIAEFLVSLAFFVPVLLFIPTLANMLLVQTTAHKASRYMAWERTAYSAQDLKSDEELANEVEQRFILGENQGFGSGQTSVAAGWMDFKTRTSMVDLISGDLASGVATDVDSFESATRLKQNASAWLADKGGLDDPANAFQLNTLQTAKLSIPISSDLSILQPTRPVDAWHYERDPDSTTAPPVDEVAKTSRYYISSSSALVADGWTSANDEMFHDRVSGMNSISRRFQNFWQNTSGLSSLISNLGFDEIGDNLFTNPAGRRASLDMVDPEQSLNLPSGALEEYRP